MTPSRETPKPLPTGDEADAAGATEELMATLADRLLDEPDQVQASDDQILGTFHLGTEEFCLRVQDVREVVPYPSQVTQLRLRQRAVLGAFSLRGELLALLDTASLMNNEELKPPSEMRRVAIVETAAGCIGLVFDRTGEILNVGPEALYDLRVGSAKDAPEDETASDLGTDGRMIRGLVQLENGARCIQHLCIDALGSIPGLPYWDGQDREQIEQIAEARRRKAVAVRLGTYEIALPIESLVEIQSGQELHVLPQASDYCVGAVELRGQLFAALDFREALGGTEDSAEERLVFVRHNGIQAALLVDSLVETLDFDAYAPTALPSLPGSGVGAICREVLVMSEERQVLMVDVQRLFDECGLGGDSAMGRVKDEKSLLDEEARAEEQRALFTFLVGSQELCLDMDSVLEIRSYPESTVPSGAGDSALTGVMTLRGSAVPLIDLRRRLGISDSPVEDEAVPELSQEERSVVLVVESKGSPFGLVADRVEGITRFHPSEAASSRDVGAPTDDCLTDVIKSVLKINRPGVSSRLHVVLSAEKLVQV